MVRVVDRVGVLDEHDAALFSRRDKVYREAGKVASLTGRAWEARVLVVCVLRPTRQYGVCARAR
jgi:hypothetical protein